VLCSRCKHDNPEENRYCGICGNRLAAPPEPAEEASSAEQETLVEVGSSRSSSSILGLDAEADRARPSRREPTISGPSFLGIGSEPERRPSGYSYLLDYDEPRSHRGLWVTLVLLVVAALVGLQFRAELRARALPLYAALRGRAYPQPPAPPTLAAPPQDSASSQPATPAPQPSGAASSNNIVPGAGVSSDAGPQASNSQGAASKPDDAASAAVLDKEKSAEAEKPAEPAKPAPTKEEAAPKKKAERPAKYARASRAAPAEAAAPEDNRLLLLAQKYIHGQGVPRNCSAGLGYLREAMKRPNSAAASQMGALYATGTCVPFDRVAAYRWFGSALQMTPSNAWLARERDELYAQMSSSERRQADRQ